VRYTLVRVGPWLLAVVVLAIQSAVLRNRDAAWIGDSLWGQETIGVAQVLVLPLIAATAAVDGWRAREGLLSLLEGGSAGRHHVVNLLVSRWGPLALAFGAANAAVLLVSWQAPLHLANGSPWPLVTQSLAAIACTCAGFALGCWAGSWTGAVAAGCVFVLLPLLGRMGSLPNGFDEFAASGSMVGAQPNPTFFSIRAVWLLAVGLGCLLAVLGPRRGWRPLGVSLVAGAGVLGLLLFEADRSYAAAGDRVYCTDTAVVVCGPVTLRHRVDEGGRAATLASQALASRGVEARTRFVMWSATTSGQDTLMLVNPGRFRDPLDRQTVIDDVVSPQSCAFWRDPTGPPDGKVFRAAAVLDGAVAAALGHRGPSGPYADFLARVPARDQAQALRSAGTALQKCRPTEIDPVFDELARRP
jgi:hypothetical protein